MTAAPQNIVNFLECMHREATARGLSVTLKAGTITDGDGKTHVAMKIADLAKVALEASNDPRDTRPFWMEHAKTKGVPKYGWHGRRFIYGDNCRYLIQGLDLKRRVNFIRCKKLTGPNAGTIFLFSRAHMDTAKWALEIGERDVAEVVVPAYKEEVIQRKIRMPEMPGVNPPLRAE